MDFEGFHSPPPARRRRNAMADISQFGAPGAFASAHMPPPQQSYASYAPTALRGQQQQQQQPFQPQPHYGHGFAAQPQPAQQVELNMHGHADLDMDLGMGGLQIGGHAAAAVGHGAAAAGPFGFQGFQQQQQQQQPGGFVFAGAEAYQGGGGPLAQQYSGDSDALSCGSDNAHDFDIEMRPASRRGSRRDSRRNAVSAEDQAAIMAQFGGM